jgi:hypothetical protein
VDETAFKLSSKRDGHGEPNVRCCGWGRAIFIFRIALIRKKPILRLYNQKKSLFLKEIRIIMKRNPHLYLSEVLFGSADKVESRAISKMLKEGVIRKIATRVYTSNLADSPEAIIKRNLFIILGHLFPKAVISHRSAFEFQPTSSRHIFLTYSYSRNVSLPGITVYLMEGQAGMPDDTPFIEGLYDKTVSF